MLNCYLCESVMWLCRWYLGKVSEMENFVCASTKCVPFCLQSMSVGVHTCSQVRVLLLSTRPLFTVCQNVFMVMNQPLCNIHNLGLIG